MNDWWENYEPDLDVPSEQDEEFRRSFNLPKNFQQGE